MSGGTGKQPDLMPTTLAGRTRNILIGRLEIRKLLKKCVKEGQTATTSQKATTTVTGGVFPDEIVLALAVLSEQVIILLDDSIT